MYHKKVWIIILIIVVASLFPSVLYANADEGDGGGGAGGIPVEGGDIPDREYSLENAPFPGTYGKITEESWQDFIERADSLGHTQIKKFISLKVGNENQEDIKVAYEPVFYSTDEYDTIIEDVFTGSQGSKWYYFSYIIKYINDNEMNILNSSQGLNVQNNIWNFSTGWVDPPTYWSYETSTWYNAEVVNDQYQNKPDQYNIDPLRGWGMYFLRPKFGEWINIPTKTYSHKDTIEIEVQVPHLYESNSVTYEMFKITEGLEKGIIPNFAIRLYSNNVKKIEGSQVVGRDGTWILPYNIKLIEGYMDGMYMHGAKFKATVPMEHAKNANWEASLIVADLFIYEVEYEESYSIMIPEARTWTKYHIF